MADRCSSAGANIIPYVLPELSSSVAAHQIAELLEMLLLLIWRHLGVFGAEERPLEALNLHMSAQLAPSFDVETFRMEAGRKLNPILQRMTAMVGAISDLSLVWFRSLLAQAQETRGLGWQSYEKYMEIMAERLRDSAGLRDTSNTEGSETEFQ